MDRDKSITDYKKVAILLVLYEDKFHIPKLISSIQNQLYQNFSIYAIETSESGESIKLLKEIYPKAKTFPYMGNLGFAAGNNFLAKKAIEDGYEYLFVLNTDMELSPNTLEIFVSYFQNDRDLGVIGSTLLIGNTNIIQLFGVDANFKTQKKELLYTNKDIAEVILPSELMVDYVNGGSMFLSREVYCKIGLFNEDYFMYNDEIDFAYRVKKAGFKTFVTSKTYIRHYHDWSKSNNKGYFLMYYYIMRNKYLYFKIYGLYYCLAIDLVRSIIKFPVTLIWAIRLVNLKLVKYYYLGIMHGLLGKKGISKFSI